MRNCVVCIGLLWLTFSIDGYNHSNEGTVPATEIIPKCTGRFTGIDFEKILVEHPSLFVDKSMLLFDLFAVDFSMIIRGRNWGKTFNLGMIHLFYGILHDKHGNLLHHEHHLRNIYFKGGSYTVKTEYGNITKLHFNPLKISSHQNVMEKMGKYPVISISFMKLIQSYDDFIENMKEEIIDNIHDRFHGDVLAKSCDEVLLSVTGSVYVADCRLLLRNTTEALNNPRILQHSLYILSAVLRQFFKRPVVILIDEYDFPLHNFIHNKQEFDKVVKFLYQFYMITFKEGSGNIHKSIVTGLLPFGRRLLSSATNHFTESTILDLYLAEHFGFTKSEVESLLKKRKHPSIKIQDLELWYGGFYIGDNKMYNPFSIHQCLSQNAEYGHYWIHGSPIGLYKPQENTSASPSLFVDSLFSTNEYQEVLQQLYCNHTRFVYLKRNIQLQTKLWSDQYLSCLTLLGYLTVSEKNGDSYVVKVPNSEIRDFLREKFREWSNKELGNENAVRITQLKETNIMVSGILAIEDFLMQTLPNIELPEKSYCDVIFSLLIGLPGQWEMNRTFSTLHYMKHIQCIITIVPMENNPNKNFVTIVIGSGSKKKILRQVLDILNNTFPFLIDQCKREVEFDIFQYIPKQWRVFSPLLKSLFKKLGSYILYGSSTNDKRGVNIQAHITAQSQMDKSIIPKNELLDFNDEMWNL